MCVAHTGYTAPVSDPSDTAAMNFDDLSAEFTRLSEYHAAWSSSEEPADHAAHATWLEPYAERMLAIRRRSIELRHHPSL